MPCLIEENVASIENKGTKYGLELANKFHRKCKIKYKEYYILKCDISKFFASIDKEILKKKLLKKIKEKDSLDIIFKVIDSQEQGLGIRKYDKPSLGYFLFKRYGSFH